MRYSLNIIFAFLLFYASASAQCPEGFDLIPVNLVKNGDFESGNNEFHSQYGYSFDLYPEGLYAVVHQPHQTHHDFTYNGDHTTGKGKMMVVNGATESGKTVWQQHTDILLTKRVYVFSAWFMTVSPASNPAVLDLSVNGEAIASVQLPANTYQWLHFSGHWIASDQTEDVNLKIVNRNTIAGGNDFAIDDIALYPCEPIFANLAEDYSLEQGLAVLTLD
jgi:hypothetical protein